MSAFWSAKYYFNRLVFVDSKFVTSGPRSGRLDPGLDQSSRWPNSVATSTDDFNATSKVVSSAYLIIRLWSKAYTTIGPVDHVWRVSVRRESQKGTDQLVTGLIHCDLNALNDVVLSCCLKPIASHVSLADKQPIGLYLFIIHRYTAAIVWEK